MTDISQVDPQCRQHPAGTQGEQQQWQYRHRQQQGGQWRNLEEQRTKHQPDAQVDQKLKHRSGQQHHWQNLQRKDDFIHITGMGSDHSGRATDGLREQIENNQPEKKNQGEFQG